MSGTVVKRQEEKLHSDNEKLRRAGAHIVRVAQDLGGPVSLIAGSIESVDRQFAALLRYVRAAGQRAGKDPELAVLHRELDVDRIADSLDMLLALCSEGAQRLIHLVDQLKLYMRRPAEGGAVTEIDVVQLLRNAAALASCGFDVSPRVEWDTAELPAVRGSAQALAHAFVNVIRNAFEAVAGRSDPYVHMSARLWRSLVCLEHSPADVSGSAAPTRQNHDASAASRPAWIEVRIRDNGPGIAAEHRERAFEAFYTTKPPGSALGLGLTIAKEEIEAAGGTIRIADMADEAGTAGAELVIRLPVAG